MRSWGQVIHCIGTSAKNLLRAVDNSIPTGRWISWSKLALLRLTKATISYSPSVPLNLILFSKCKVFFLHFFLKMIPGRLVPSLSKFYQTLPENYS